MENKPINFSLENLKRIAASDLMRVDSLDDLVKYIQILWCKRYNRPLKDPLLQTYTVHELLYEFCLWGFLEDPKKLDEFALKDNGTTAALEHADEDWFKTQMGDGYTEADYTSDEGQRALAALKQTKGDLDDLPDGEHTF